jgi:SAM-dependent methyltransferase
MMTRVTPDAIVWAYRILLNREPENLEVIQHLLDFLRDNRHLREHFLLSEEFRRSNPHLAVCNLRGLEPPMQIEEVVSKEKLQVLFDHIQATWQILGQTEPHWSVLSSEGYKQSSIQSTKDALDNFYATGQHEVIRFLSTLERNLIDCSSLKTCLEFGCGVGRVTQWLSERFDQVFAFDISSTHLEIAQNRLHEEGINNVMLRHINELNDMIDLPKVDVLYTIIVLQHNPPPVIRFLISQLLKALKPNGIAFFQVPTYRTNYMFSLGEYLSTNATQNEMEMHVLPQKNIFEVLEEENCSLIEVINDSYSGGFGVSNTFLARKK